VPADWKDKGALLQTLRVCGAVSRGGAPPADGIPVRQLALTEQEGPPALPHPARPPCAGGSRLRPRPLPGAGPQRARLAPRRGPRPYPRPASCWRGRPERRGGAGAPASASLAGLAAPGRGRSAPRPLDGAGRLLARGLPAAPPLLAASLAVTTLAAMRERGGRG